MVVEVVEAGRVRVHIDAQRACNATNTAVEAIEAVGVVEVVEVVDAGRGAVHIDIQRP